MNDRTNAIYYYVNKLKRIGIYADAWGEWYCTARRDMLIDKYYQDARKVLQIDFFFDEFKEAIINDWNYFQRKENPHPRPRHYKWYGWYDKSTKYVKQSYHEKKELSEHERIKRVWREKKKVRKDKAKPYYGNGRRKWGRKWRNKLCRTKARDRLHSIVKEAYGPRWWEDRAYLDGMENAWELHYAENDWDSFYVDHYHDFIEDWA